MSTLQEINQLVGKNQNEVGVQVSRAVRKMTNGASPKPYWSATVSDATFSATLSFWSDTGAFAELEANPQGGFYYLSGAFDKNNYGLNCAGAVLRMMNTDESAAFLAGGADAVATANTEWAEIFATAESMSVEPIKIVLLNILNDPKNQERFRRAAAALKNHHNRRGGLLSHTVSMLRTAKSLVPQYPDVCPDLLYAGLIMHDFGKILENDTFDGFSAVPTVTGELLGHISIAAITLAKYWREAATASPELFKGKNYMMEYWVHLILSHHGQKDFGSPATPKMPEAFLLHYIDLLDAHMEMVRVAYLNGTPNEQGLTEAGFPLKTSLVPMMSKRLAEEK